MTDPVIKVINAKKEFTLGRNAVSALRGIDMEIESGEFVVIYGPSGSGKTTLLSLLAGLDDPTSGQIYVRDTDLATLSRDQLAQYRRSKIGMVFQQFNLVPTLTARDIVALPLILSGVKRSEANKRAIDLLKIVDLEERIYHRPSEMSGGQQQRVAIARALSCNPWILFVDEPTGNLDPARSLEIMTLMERINKLGTTVLVVTHEKELVNRFSKRVIAIDNGKVISDGMDGYYNYEA
jgi:cell division transport system ATP-binding protein